MYVRLLLVDCADARLYEVGMFVINVTFVCFTLQRAFPALYGHYSAWTLLCNDPFHLVAKNVDSPLRACHAMVGMHCTPLVIEWLKFTPRLDPDENIKQTLNTRIYSLRE